MTLKCGDRVRVIYRAEEIKGEVCLVSSNGRSLALTFDGILGGWAGGMPVMLEGEDRYVDLIGEQVEITRLEEE